MPKASGTAGTLAWCMIVSTIWLIYPPSTGFLPLLCVAIVVSLLSLPITAIYLKSVELDSSNPHACKNSSDPKEVVIDEWAGMAIAMVWCGGNFVALLIAFLLFRLFDIWKPGPVAKMEELKGAYGVVADDIVAGLIAAAVGFVTWLIIAPLLGPLGQ